jgi:Tfp pilus assembly protein PilO
MIVCRKPWTLYDVDLLGATGVVVLAVAAWFVVLAPWRSMWGEYRTLVAARTAAEANLRREVTDLEHFETGLAQLEDVVASEAANVPRAEAFARLLRSLTDAAVEAQLELLNVSPLPTTISGAYLVSDIKLGGRGRSQDFIRFLDRLARENPYQYLQTCSIMAQKPALADSHSPLGQAPGPTPQSSISSPQSGGSAACDLNWTVRLYLLPDAPSEREAAASARRLEAGATGSPVSPGGT